MAGIALWNMIMWLLWKVKFYLFKVMGYVFYLMKPRIPTEVTLTYMVNAMLFNSLVNLTNKSVLKEGDTTDKRRNRIMNLEGKTGLEKAKWE